MRKFILFLALFSNHVLNCQIVHSCSYNTPSTIYETINLDPNNSENLDAVLLIRKMLKPIGLEANFIPLKINGINNCAAITKNGLRLIIYDDLFLQKLNTFSNTDWIKVSVFAHEIGHHLNGHTLFFALSAQGKRANELQADEFSGFLMQKLGATIEQAKAGIEILGSEDDSDTHPSKGKRLAAIENGYNEAERQEKKIITQTAPQAEKYFIDASNAYEQLLENSNYFAGNNIKDRVNSTSENAVLDKILEDLSVAIKLNPNSDDIYFLRASVRFLQHNVEGAERDLTETLRINPKNSLAYYKFSEIELEKNDLEKALQNIEKSITYNSTFAQSYLHKGIIFSQMNKHIEAIDIYNRAIELDQKNSLFYYNRGLSFARLGKKDEAKKDFQKSIELDPTDEMAFFELGKIYQTEKNYNEAINMFTKAIQIDPKYAWAYNRRGEVYSWDLMDKEEALKDFNKAIELDAKFPFPYKNRGYIHFFNNDFEKAIIDFDKAYKLDPDPFGNGYRVLFHKGKARIQIKDFKKGYEDVKESIFFFELYLKNSNDSFLKGMLADAYYLCAYAAHELSMEKEKMEYLQKGCDIGVKECCEALKQAKK